MWRRAFTKHAVLPDTWFGCITNLGVVVRCWHSLAISNMSVCGGGCLAGPGPLLGGWLMPLHPHRAAALCVNTVTDNSGFYDEMSLGALYV